MAAPMEISADWTEHSRKQVEALGGVTSRAVDRAARRAAKKTARWLRARIARAVAGELGGSVRRLQQMRIVASQDRQTGESRIWIGTRDVPVHRMGRVKWTRRMRGARVGRKQYPGTFAPWEGGPVFRRTGAARLPIERMETAIHKIAEENVRRLEARARRRFAQLLEQELNYEMSKAYD